MTSILAETELNNMRRGCISSSGESLLSVINDMLDFPKIEYLPLNGHVHLIESVSLEEASSANISCNVTLEILRTSILRSERLSIEAFAKYIGNFLV